MADTTRYPRKYTTSPVRYGREKFIQMLPCIVTTSSTGSPADWNVNSNITMTNRAVNMVMMLLSMAKESLKSLLLVELPTR